MTPRIRTYAERGIALLEAALQKQPPAGVSPEYVTEFFALYGQALEDELAALLGQLIGAEEAVPFRVALKAEPNPDFRPGSHQAELNVPLSWESVPSLKAAVDRVREFIGEHNLGGGNYSLEAGRVTRDGKPYARISYNSNIWKVDEAWRDTGQRLDADGELSPALPPIEEVTLPPDEWTAAARTQANLLAIRLLASHAPIGPEERQRLLRYSGWGGLSIDKVADELPEGYKPEARGLIHEYYTPTRVAREIARVLRPKILELPNYEGVVQALEPSAGIGRMVHALSGPGFEALAWTAIEYSHISARLLSAVRPDIAVYEGPFERWVAEHEAALGGKLGLVVSNPPYGQRGGSLTEDPNKDYRERKAYAYFLRRGLDLLAAGGIGVFLIPYGFLTGQSAALRALRERVLRRHHLLVAFRLPSKLFPGALLVTDLLFFQARGGELEAVLADDEPILEGHYFEQYPTHILGTERGRAEDEDDTTRKPRWGYQVEGEFSRLPEFQERAFCTSCAVSSFYMAPARPRVKKKAEDLSPRLQTAVALGDRVSQYLGLLARGDAESMRTAAALYTELHDALLAWRTAQTAEVPDGGE